MVIEGSSVVHAKLNRQYGNAQQINDAVTCGKNGAKIGPAISSSRSSVTLTTTVAPLQQK